LPSGNIDIQKALSTASPDLNAYIVMLCMEIERLHNVNGDLYSELVALKAQGSTSVASFGGDSRVGLLEVENRRLTELVSTYTKELEANRQKDSKIHDLEMQVKYLSNENGRLVSVMANNSRELQELHVRIMDSTKNQTALEDAENKIIMLASELERLNHVTANSTRQSQVWKSNYTELENKITLLIGENERLNALIDEYSSQIEIWKKKYLETESFVQKHSEAQTQKQGLEYEVNRLNDALAVRVKESELLRQKVSELERQTAQSNELQSRVGYQNNEIERLNSSMTRFMGEIEEKNKKLGSYTQAYKELEDKITLLIAENDR